MKIPNIRFNLKFYAPDGSDIVIRTLADLEANLNLSDLWDYFTAGDLARWLRSIDESVKADSLVKLNQKSDGVGIALGEVCRVLQLAVPDQEIAAFVEMEERRRSRVEQSTPSDEDPVSAESYIELVRGLIKNKFDILQTHKIMVKMLNHYPDSFVRDFCHKRFIEFPYMNLLAKVLDDAWLMMLGCYDQYVWVYHPYTRSLEYCSGCTTNGKSFTFCVMRDCNSDLNGVLEVVDANMIPPGRIDLGGADGYHAVFKQEVIERLQEQDVMHDFAFTHD